MSEEFDYSKPHGIRDNVPYYLTEEEIAAREAQEAEWWAGADRRAALEAIMMLEAQVTPRRMREAALYEDGREWLQEIEAQIAALRTQL